MNTRETDFEGLGAAALKAAQRPLEEALTLPPAAYTSAAVYRTEIERLLRREWLCVGRVDQLDGAASYFTLDLLGERLLVVRDEADTIRVMSRVCRHRAADVAKGAGRTRAFTCPYHAWTYRLDGSLHRAPLMDERAPGGDPDCALRRFRTEVWEGWIFVNFDDEAAPLGPQLAPLAETLAPYRMAELVAVPVAEFDSPFNWKVLVDNFMEAYHHIAIHRESIEPVYPAAGSSVPDNHGPYSLLEMPAREGIEPDTDQPSLPAHEGLSAAERNCLLAAVVYPFHLFAPSAESVAWYHVLPLSHDRFTLRIYTCLPRATLDDPARAEAIEALRALMVRVHHEDIGACEAAWRGLTSPSAVPGRLCHLERTLWQFNQWWIERMAADR